MGTHDEEVRYTLTDSEHASQHERGHRPGRGPGPGYLYAVWAGVALLLLALLLCGLGVWWLAAMIGDAQIRLFVW